MKQIIKHIIPARLLKWYRHSSMRASEFSNKTTSEVFTAIYNKKIWKGTGSISGTGSGLEQTKSLRTDLEHLLKQMNITSVLDIPCGDFNWMQKVDLSDVHYIGADIVEALIKNNKEQFGEKTNRVFMVLDLIKDPLPIADLIIVRDCLVHFSYADIFAALKNIKSSGCKYLLTTTFTRHPVNRDVTTGRWRTLNLQEKPFNFPAPTVIIDENCTEENGRYADKSMALWELKHLPD